MPPEAAGTFILVGLEVLTRLERCAEPPGGAGTRNLDIGVFSHVRDRCAGSLQVHKNLIECYVSESNMSFRSQSPAGMRKGAICELHVDQFYDCRITRPVVPGRRKTRLFWSIDGFDVVQAPQEFIAAMHARTAPPAAESGRWRCAF